MTDFNMEEVKLIAGNIRGLSDGDLLRLMETLGKAGKSKGFRKGVVIGILALPTIKLGSKLTRKLIENGIIAYFKDKSILLDEREGTGDYEIILKDTSEIGE